MQQTEAKEVTTDCDSCHYQGTIDCIFGGKYRCADFTYDSNKKTKQIEVAPVAV
jgi:hypothetical protein